jgi:methylated-DNA-[protein]-cysteine S-methyltransferase
LLKILEIRRGISRIEILDSEKLHREEIPEELLEAIEQLKAYFSGELKDFNIKMNPSGN